MSAILSSQNGIRRSKTTRAWAHRLSDEESDEAARQEHQRLRQKPYGCTPAPLRCGYILEYDKLPYMDKETHRPEHETIASFGSLILNHDLDLLLQANEYLNRAGMDTISAGVVVAYVLEGVEKGFFKKEDFICRDYPEGFLPVWGDPTYIMSLLKLMVTREGIGNKLADGVHVAKAHFPGTEPFAISVNGSEMGMHDLRMGKDWAMSAVSDPTPGRHTTANYAMSIMGMLTFSRAASHGSENGASLPTGQGSAWPSGCTR